MSIKSNHTQLATNHRHSMRKYRAYAANRFALHTIAYTKHVAWTKNCDERKRRNSKKKAHNNKHSLIHSHIVQYSAARHSTHNCTGTIVCPAVVQMLTLANALKISKCISIRRTAFRIQSHAHTRRPRQRESAKHIHSVRISNTFKWTPFNSNQSNQKQRKMNCQRLSEQARSING